MALPDDSASIPQLLGIRVVLGRRLRRFNQAGRFLERRETQSHVGDGGLHVLAAPQLHTELVLDGFEVTGQTRQGVGALSVGHRFGGLPSAPCAERFNPTH